MEYCDVGYTWNVRVLKVMIAIRLEKSEEIHMTAYFWDLSYSVLVELFLLFLRSCLFI